MEKILINICVGIVIIIGFFIYWSKNSNAFEEGGIMYELMSEIKARRKSKKNIKNTQKAVQKKSNTKKPAKK